jgi:hypothetical protein
MSSAKKRTMFGREADDAPEEEVSLEKLTRMMKAHVMQSCSMFVVTLFPNSIVIAPSNKTQ